MKKDSRAETFSEGPVAPDSPAVDVKAWKQFGYDFEEYGNNFMNREQQMELQPSTLDRISMYISSFLTWTYFFIICYYLLIKPQGDEFTYFLFILYNIYYLLLNPLHFSIIRNKSIFPSQKQQDIIRYWIKIATIICGFIYIPIAGYFQSESGAALNDIAGILLLSTPAIVKNVWLTGFFMLCFPSGMTRVNNRVWLIIFLLSIIIDFLLNYKFSTSITISLFGIISVVLYLFATVCMKAYLQHILITNYLRKLKKKQKQLKRQRSKRRKMQLQQQQQQGDKQLRSQSRSQHRDHLDNMTSNNNNTNTHSNTNTNSSLNVTNNTQMINVTVKGRGPGGAYSIASSTTDTRSTIDIMATPQTESGFTYTDGNYTSSSSNGSDMSDFELDDDLITQVNINMNDDGNNTYTYTNTRTQSTRPKFGFGGFSNKIRRAPPRPPPPPPPPRNGTRKTPVLTDVGFDRPSIEEDNSFDLTIGKNNGNNIGGSSNDPILEMLRFSGQTQRQTQTHVPAQYRLHLRRISTQRRLKESDKRSSLKNLGSIADKKSFFEKQSMTRLSKASLYSNSSTIGNVFESDFNTRESTPNLMSPEKSPKYGQLSPLSSATASVQSRDSIVAVDSGSEGEIVGHDLKLNSGESGASGANIMRVLSNENSDDCSDVADKTHKDKKKGKNNKKKSKNRNKNKNGNKNSEIEKKRRKKASKTSKAPKTVYFCFDKYFVKSSTFWKGQCVLNASTFWPIWGIWFIRHIYGYFMAIPFLIATNIFNPVFYSPKRNTTSNRSKLAKIAFQAYTIIGIINVICYLFFLIFQTFWVCEFEDAFNINPPHRGGGAPRGGRCMTNSGGSSSSYVVIGNETLVDNNMTNSSNYSTAIGPAITTNATITEGEAEHPVHLLLGGMHIYTGFFYCGLLGYYMPSTGYLFYKKSVTFGLVHLLFASFTFILPLFVTESSQSVLQDGATNSILQHEGNATIGAIMLCTFVLAMFLSFSGFSCSYYRFKVEILCVLCSFCVRFLCLFCLYMYICMTMI